MCFPHLPTAKPYGQGTLDAIDGRAVAIRYSVTSFLTARAHKVRSLIMSLATWVGKNIIPKWLAYFYLVLGTRFLAVCADAIKIAIPSHTPFAFATS